MNTAKLLGAECLVAFGINSFQAVKQGYVPFPGTLCMTAASYGIISLIGYIDEDLAGLLGAGFLLAILVMQASSGWETFAARAPADSKYYTMQFGGGSSGEAAPAN